MNEIFGIIEKAKTVPGAISVTEMMVIYKAVVDYLKVPLDLKLEAVDLGSHAGKSSMIGSAALHKLGRKDRFCMVDLIYNTNDPEWWDTYQGNEAKKAGVNVKECIPWPIANDPKKLDKILIAHNSVSGLRAVVYGQSSLNFLSQHKGPFSYVFIDTDDHRPDLVVREAEAIINKVEHGGLVFFHDYGNYPGPVAAGLWLKKSGKYEELDLDWTWASILVKSYSLDGGNDSWAPPEHKHVGCFRRL